MKSAKMIITNGKDIGILDNARNQNEVANLEDRCFLVRSIKSFSELNGWRAASEKEAEAFEDNRDRFAKAVAASMNR